MSVEDFVPEVSDELDLGVDLSTVPQQHAVPSGEYLVVLADCSIESQKPEKGSGKFIKAVFEIEDDPDAKLITHVMMIPSSSDKKRTANGRLRAIGDFYKAFNIPSSGAVRLSEYIGNRGWVTLKVEVSEDYGEQNRVVKFIAGR
jgi:hypothetical protein